jgi:APA family basic amino acid/polyamine antiporter
VLYLAQRTFGGSKPDLADAAGVAAAGPTDREV